MTTTIMKPRTAPETTGRVHCPICTHTVNAAVVAASKPYVKPGEKCPRCASGLDAGVVLTLLKAA